MHDSIVLNYYSALCVLVGKGKLTYVFTYVRLLHAFKVPLNAESEVNVCS